MMKLHKKLVWEEIVSHDGGYKYRRSVVEFLGVSIEFDVSLDDDELKYILTKAHCLDCLMSGADGLDCIGDNFESEEDAEQAAQKYVDEEIVKFFS